MTSNEAPSHQVTTQPTQAPPATQHSAPAAQTTSTTQATQATQPSLPLPFENSGRPFSGFAPIERLQINHLPDDELLYYANLPVDNVIVVDTETTGLEPSDEVISYGICTAQGDEIANQLVRPTRHTAWPEAEKINHISWDDVKAQPHLTELEPSLSALWANSALLVGYNIGFDQRLLHQSGVNLSGIEAFDLMEAFARLHCQWNRHRQAYRWLRLTDVATIYDYQYEAHDSLNDARATAFCYLAFREECRKIATSRNLEQAAASTPLATGSASLAAASTHSTTASTPLTGEMREL